MPSRVLRAYIIASSRTESTVIICFHDQPSGCKCNNVGPNEVGGRKFRGGQRTPKAKSVKVSDLAPISTSSFLIIAYPGS